MLRSCLRSASAHSSKTLSAAISSPMCRLAYSSAAGSIRRRSRRLPAARKKGFTPSPSLSPIRNSVKPRIAGCTAKHLGTDHREFALSDQDMLARLDEAVCSFDQPSMDGINTYFVSWAARQAGLKVALSGLGSDELFGGYASFRDAPRVANLAALARLSPKTIAQAHRGADARLEGPEALSRRFPEGIRRVARPRSAPAFLFFHARPFHASGRRLAARRKREIMESRRRGADGLARAAQEARTMDNFTAVSWLELRSYLANTLLRDTDAMSMRHSLEVRVPFLDSPLVEYVLSAARNRISARRAGRKRC